MSDLMGKGRKLVHLKGGTLVDLSPARLRREDLWLEGGRIVAVGQPAGLAGAENPIEVDCSGCLILPGLVCGHGHLYSALAAGMPGPAQPPTNFVEILERVWWRLDEALDEESLRLSAQVGALSALRSGTTTIIDHHASPSFIDGSLDVVADALEEIGLRSVLCYEVTDRGGMDRRDAGLRENERFIRSERMFSKGLVGAHASFTLSQETLERCADLVQRLDTGLHVHLAEDDADQRDSLKKYGKRVLKRMADVGVLGAKTLFAHGVFIDEEEAELLRDSSCWIAHNPRSNMNNSVGYADPFRFGEQVILGTDGIGADMMSESQHAFFRGRERQLATDAALIMEWLCGSYTLLGSLFEQPIGQLEPGTAADVLVLDAETPTPLTAGNLPWHWMFGFSSRMIRDVFVDGRAVVRNRVFPDVDEERVLVKAREVAPKLWARMGS